MKIASLLTALIAIAIVACTDSDNYIFDERDHQEVRVDAFITQTFDETSVRIKNDTVAPNDSLIFLSSVYPSKAIRSQDIFWTLDGTPFATEYSFKASVKTPGLLKVAFVLVDFFGDTISDTITLYAAIPPTLNLKKIIPANSTQEIPPNEDINFSWYTTEQDRYWDTYYHFVLKEAFPTSQKDNGIILDTILSSSTFSYNKGLAPLAKYTWSVSAYNELDMKSSQSIEGEFYTAGLSNESGILATVIPPSKQIPQSIQVTIISNSGDTLYRAKEFHADSAGRFYIKPITPGKITFTVSASDTPDLQPIIREISLKENQVYSLDSLQFADITPPTISSIDNKDTLLLQDTLNFILKDGGGNVVLSTSSAKLDGNIILDYNISRDTLKVIMPISSTWTYRILSIEVYDQSGNKSTRHFYLYSDKTYREDP